MQALLAKVCAELNCKDTIKASWFQKMPMSIKYRSVPYKELLLSLSIGAVDGEKFICKQASVAFALIAANEPLRTDYRKIVIADRYNPLPAKTPYYLDGKVYFPDGSRVNTGRGSPTLDVGESRELIDAFIGQHRSQFLLGSYMAPNTFSHLLLDESERQLGDKLGICFFRVKFAAEHRAQSRAVNRQLQVMDHDMPTHDTFYTPPVEFDDALNAPMDDVEMEEEEMEGNDDVEMEVVAKTGQNAVFY